MVTGALSASGSARQIVTTARGLAAGGVQPVVVDCTSLAHEGAAFFRPLLESAGVTVCQFGELAGGGATLPARAVRLLSMLPARLRARIEPLAADLAAWGPDVVHAWLDEACVVAGFASVLTGVPRVVLTARSLRPPLVLPELPRYFREAYRALLDHTSVVLCAGSHAIARDYAEWLGVPTQSIPVVLPGLDPATVGRAGRPQGTWSEDAVVVGGALRLREEKRPGLWLETAARVARERPEVRFVLLGDGPLRPEMERRAAELGLSARLEMPGAVLEVGPWLRSFQVVLVTSRIEGLGNVPIEAQALGVPVVTPDVGGVGESLAHGETGWLVASDDPEALAERVLFVLDHPEWRAAAAAAGPRLMAERFGLERMLRQTRQVYGWEP
jgi:glycosyltransferase involved in cell wall biosynthesis